jgi:hypothetical protein
MSNSLDYTNVDMFVPGLSACILAIQNNIADVGSPSNLLILSEVPTEPINGVNATFTTVHPFIPETVEVMLNGLKQHQTADFNTNGDRTIILAESPDAGEILQINYIKQ